MIDKQELTKRLMATFLEELHEHTGAWSDHLLALEKGPSGPDRSELLKSLFRSAHSLKGACPGGGRGADRASVPPPGGLAGRRA